MPNLKEHLFYILTKLKDESLFQGDKKIDLYLNNEKLSILKRHEYRSENFHNFLQENFLDTKQRGHYVFGTIMSTTDWLIEMFHEISHSKNYFKMYDLIKKIFVQLK
jgi:hypothetical protein